MRILIADDHPVFRHGVAAILAADSDLDVVGEAQDGEQAVAAATELNPDLILMDVAMPGVNGIEATRRILATRPNTRILMVTMFEDDASAGRRNPDIAQDLHLSHSTVRNYVSSIFAKLQVADRANAIVRARQAGLG